MNKLQIDFKLSQSSILLAGATKGVGLELAKLLIKCEAKVGIIGRTKSDGENAIKEIQKNNKNSEVFFIQGDLYS
ncbi:SDR family NAD(P)-dependent oxidoreductase, partial [bacterium]|nr:SDR family NAD(P)-dependent oxidoreductase [bacterium]